MLAQIILCFTPGEMSTLSQYCTQTLCHVRKTKYFSPIEMSALWQRCRQTLCHTGTAGQYLTPIGVFELLENCPKEYNILGKLLGCLNC